jgi:hypothetical protein
MHAQVRLVLLVLRTHGPLHTLSALAEHGCKLSQPSPTTTLFMHHIGMPAILLL